MKKQIVLPAIFLLMQKIVIEILVISFNIILSYLLVNIDCNG